MALPQAKIEPQSLGLRKIRFSQELAFMKLPKDPDGLIGLALKYREQGIESMYRLVFIFVQLEKTGGDYWTKYDCRSIEELLTKLDLPIGKTLNKWRGLVELFELDTLKRLGKDTIYLMQRSVTKYQEDDEEAKKDYEKIFALYCRTNNTYDKKKFEESIYFYCRKKYVNPTLKKVVSNIDPLPRLPLGIKSQLVARPAETPMRLQAQPLVSQSLRIETRADSFRTIALRYIEELEYIIRSELGAKRLPQRPQELR